MSSGFRPGKPESPWPKVAAVNLLSQLHAKFWGKRGRVSMTGNAGSKEVMLGRGCFALDLGIDFILRTFWLRQDYIRLYEHLPGSNDGSFC